MIVLALESTRLRAYVPIVANEHELLREVAYWRDILSRIADDVEQSGGREEDP